jgi:hypothetical protein
MDSRIIKKVVYSQDEKFDEVSDIGKKMARMIEFNKIVYTELILSINVKASDGKVA